MVDFRTQLKRQIKFITNSCQLYDQGCVEEAVRIAAVLRVLFHDSNRSVSLLTHLRSNSITLLSTAAPFDEDPILPNLYLVQEVAKLIMGADISGDDMRCVCEPLLASSLRNDIIPFDVWWDTELVIEHKQPKTSMTRKKLVLTAANQDGGAHVDEKLDDTYDYVKRGSGVEITLNFKPEWKRPPLTLPYENVHFASLRQIAYEVTQSPALLALSQ
jgi:hypothetical protein